MAATPPAWKFSGQTLFFRESAKLLKILTGKKYVYSEEFQGKLYISGQVHVAKKCEKIFNSVNCEKIFNSVYPVYIHLRVIRAIWASVVCNLVQSRPSFSVKI